MVEAILRALYEDGPQTAEALASRFTASRDVIRQALAELVFERKRVTCRIIGGTWRTETRRWHGGECVYLPGHRPELLVAA